MCRSYLVMNRWNFQKSPSVENTMKRWFTKSSLPLWRQDEAVRAPKKHARKFVVAEENPGGKKVRVERERVRYEAQFGAEVGERSRRNHGIFRRK
jgi:hypothetical protein